MCGSSSVDDVEDNIDFCQRELIQKYKDFTSTPPTSGKTRMIGGDAPDFVEVGEEDVAVSDAMLHRRCVQFVG
jgi:hypothetical protein